MALEILYDILHPMSDGGSHQIDSHFCREALTDCQ
jgi:hypothetical protein